MLKKNFDLIDEMLRDTVQEQESIKKQIQSNLEEIQEIDKYLQSLMKDEDSDYNVFHPRAPKDIYQKEVEKRRLEKEVLESRNREYYHKVNCLEKDVKKLKDILTEGISDEDDSKLLFHVDMHQRDKKLEILNIQEKERQRIARDLHDTSLQNLAHIVHKIELSSLFIDQDPIRAKLELAVTSKSLKSIIEEIRGTIFDLRPMTFDDLGLKEALERLLMLADEKSDIVIKQEIENVSCENDLVLATIYRVAQECIQNAIKHSEAKEIRFRCIQNENVCQIYVEDDGKGFTAEDVSKKQDKHFGLFIMNERISLLGGKMKIDSKVNVGTKVEILIPLK